jgi:hypothetical protein
MAATVNAGLRAKIRSECFRSWTNVAIAGMPAILSWAAEARPGLDGGRYCEPSCPVAFAKLSLSWRIQFLGTEKPWPTLGSQTRMPLGTFLR